MRSLTLDEALEVLGPPRLRRRQETHRDGTDGVHNTLTHTQAERLVEAGCRWWLQPGRLGLVVEHEDGSRDEIEHSRVAVERLTREG